MSGLVTGYKKSFDQKELKKMSLQLVSDLSNEIETIVGVDGNLWFKRAHVGKYLDIKDIKHNFRDFHITPVEVALLVRKMSVKCLQVMLSGPALRIRKLNVIFFY